MQENGSPVTQSLMMAPLYAGPLIGGWMGAPVSLVLALAALFLLAQLGTGKQQARGPLPLPAYLIMLAGAQLLVVAVTFAIGGGLRVMSGPLPSPIWLPLVLTASGALIFARRYRYAPGETDTTDATGEDETR